MKTTVTPGLYRHWKEGKLYRVLAQVLNETNGKPVVLYVPDQAPQGTIPFVRNANDFEVIVHTSDGSVCEGPNCNRVVGSRYSCRFTRVGD